MSQALNPVRSPLEPPVEAAVVRVLRRFSARVRSLPVSVLACKLVNRMLEPLLSGPFGLIYVMEHPKCGGTWLRNMLRIYNGTPAFLGDRLIRPHDVVQAHRLRGLWHPGRVVVLVRDPRDVFVSQYYYETRFRRRPKGLEIERYFTHDPNRPLREDFTAYLETKLRLRTNPSFSYGDFVGSWLECPRVCWVRYEDCLRNAEPELARVVRWLGLPYDVERIRHAVEVNRFENVTRARTGQARKPGEEDPTEFERKGISGDWRNHFDERSCELIERSEGWTLRALGYESEASWISRFLAERRSSV